MAGHLTQYRREVLDFNDRHMAYMSEIIVQHSDRTIQEIDVFADALVRRFATSDRSVAEFGQASESLIRRRLGDLPQIARLVLADAAGDVVYESGPGPLPDINIADRRYFQQQRDNPGPGFVLGNPLVSQADGTRVVPMSWRLDAPDGAFRGVIALSLDAGHFGDLFQRLLDNSSTFAALYKPDGTVLLFDGEHDVLSDRPDPRVPLFARLGAARGGSTEHAEGQLGDVETTWRIVSHSTDYGDLRVAVGVPRPAILEGWTREALLLSIATLLVVALVMALTSVLILAVVRLRRAHDAAVAAQRAAESVDQAKSDFLAKMSHEIRTPMNAVLGMTDLLLREPLMPRQIKFARVIKASGETLLGVINDVLDLSKLEAGGVQLEEVDFSVPRLLDEIAQQMRGNAEQRGLFLRVEIDADSPPALRGDPLRLRQILLNLASNAIKFTEHGGVTIRAKFEQLDDDSVIARLEVQDTGIGIAEEQQATLFDRFTQADSAITRKYGGTGLGLAICRELVLLQNGRIGVDCKAGFGSLFWFEIPYKLGVHVAPNEDPLVDLDQLPPLRILVAEDVLANQFLMREVLNRHCRELKIVANGAEAVAAVTAQEYDLVLMDVQMPLMDGVTATREIRALPGPRAEIPIIGLTANAMTGQRAEYLAAGMDHCVTKPVRWPELMTAIARYAAEGRCGPVPLPHDVDAEINATATFDETVLATLRGTFDGAKLDAMMNEALREARGKLEILPLTADDPARIRSEAHSLQGLLANYGFLRLAIIAQELQNRCGDRSAVGRLMELFAAALEETDAAVAARRRAA